MSGGAARRITSTSKVGGSFEQLKGEKHEQVGRARLEAWGSAEDATGGEKMDSGP